jgi:hypothetical protein
MRKPKISDAARRRMSRAAKARWKRAHTISLANGTTRSPSPAQATRPHRSVNGRLGAYLKRFAGTPMEMTEEQFMEKLVSLTLDRLGA